MNFECDIKKCRTSTNIIFKQQLLRSLGLWMDFEEGFQQTTPLGFMNTGTLDEITMQVLIKIIRGA
ncbi:hypothetical protein PaelaDRAFT_0609 [Paenibacillus lactis 154]|uniref:Uncharacterized protein n=1 Tax=Paenibacillus lactis 154 TaxID=743719 RepID=G4H9E8_9BACL|nr:hypothetical protein PaelaDRAFT_0609 [Paenibacillus lactis 154]